MLNEKSVTGHAVVVGAGVMGAGIAAILANAGWRVSLLDRVPEGVGTDTKSRNRLAQEGLDRALKAKPPHFALPAYAARVRVGNTADNLARMADADWVVEAAAEDPAVKRDLMEAIAAHAGPETVVSSNTSGLSLAGMVAGCLPEFRSRFLGTHFFNPPRYMKPLELIPTAETSLEVFEGFARFAERVLGKRVIRAKDTPGFISTRLGMYALATTISLAVAHGLTVEETDYLTGPLIGRPKSGTFRLADVIGLDITARIIDNLARDLPNDAAYQGLRLPALMRKLIEVGRTGAKAGGGFYRREPNGEIRSLDLATGEYRPRREPDPFAQELETRPLAERLRTLCALQEDRRSVFLRDMLRATLGYMVDVTPQVADRIVEVDDAITGGFGWEVGPFHALDALGLLPWLEPAPAMVRQLREAGEERFYYNRDGHHFYFDFHTGKMEPLPRPPEVIVLKDLKKAGKTVEQTENAAMVDLGDGALCVEWRTKLNVLDPDVMAFLNAARQRAERDFACLIVGGSGESLSAGFNLSLLARMVEEHDWKGIDGAMAAFQSTTLSLKYARVPVVSLAYGYTLGGGCEIMLHAAAVQAAFESSIGLPEANAGLIPVGGGIAEMLVRAMAEVPPGTVLEANDPFPFVRPVWDNLRLARFSGSADEAVELGYLRPGDAITRHPDHLLFEAKQRALALATDYRPPQPSRVPVMGEEGLARFRWEIHLLRRADQITDHDARIAERAAYVLCGGEVLPRTKVDEEYLRDLEREAFLSLAGTPETLARIKHLVSTGKPLRN